MLYTKPRQAGPAAFADFLKGEGRELLDAVKAANVAAPAGYDGPEDVLYLVWSHAWNAAAKYAAGQLEDAADSVKSAAADIDEMEM